MEQGTSLDVLWYLRQGVPEEPGKLLGLAVNLALQAGWEDRAKPPKFTPAGTPLPLVSAMSPQGPFLLWPQADLPPIGLPRAASQGHACMLRK